ncbi:TIGR03745 family integrating conjugative element membrane protein [Halomonas colorata]|uniref:TIGR03745 family integrating conjugative element membrane protein n=1 Tax=Halomonas colorata TaxID=2742615 RepID=UPI00186965DC|nr:TIGR03745 family integrating conjugative element membrane protein [Halomonas colorata]
MKRHLKAIGFNRVKQFLSWGVALVLSLPALAMAQLPTLEEPSQGDGGLISTLQGYLYDFGALIGLILCVVAFLIVGASSIASFKEARERETWGKFTVTVVVGVVLIVAIIWLATEALPILSQS